MNSSRTASAQGADAPRKAISPSRDRLQSVALTLLLSLTLVAVCALLLLARPIDAGSIEILAISVGFAVLTAALRAATVPGSIAGALTCLSLTGWTVVDPTHPLRASALPALGVLVILTSLATRAGRRRKESLRLAEPRAGRRASQVLANLGMAALAASPIGALAAHGFVIPFPVSPATLATAALAALAEATADTISSEIGQAFGAHTVLITSLRRVPRGTDGGVSVLGTLAGISGASLVVWVGAACLHLSHLMAGAALLAGIVGLLADSILGATLERRGWIGNDLVNFLSTAVASSTALLLAHLW